MIRIHTYSDPYAISQTAVWEEIRYNPWFCGSQVMANAVEKLYQSELIPGQVSTVTHLSEALFPEWTDSAAGVLLNVAIERIIQEMADNGDLSENDRHVWLSNRSQTAEVIRSLIDFGLLPEMITIDHDSREQEIALKIYERILADRRFRAYFDERPVSLTEAINQGLKEDKNPGDYSFSDQKTLVLIGIHQFTPMMVRAIRTLEQDYDLLFLFNYRQDYSRIYQTWQIVYKEMNVQIKTEPDLPVRSGSASARFGSSLGNLFQGKIYPEMFSSQIELIEFDNEVSFAHYVAERFEQARMKNPEKSLGAMKEKFYSANTDINQILQVYFPKQFEEKNLMNYPIGQFFLGMAQLWNIEQENLTFENPDAILKLLSTGMISEDRPGQLISAMHAVFPYVRHCKTITELIERLQQLEDLKDSGEDFQEHLGYFQISDNDLRRLIEALEELRTTSVEYFEVFENGTGNFSEFYRRLEQFIHREIEQDRYLQKDIVQILEKVSFNLKKLNRLQIVGSLETMIRTMDLFLSDDSKDRKSPSWIVKGFQQIEGDILQSQFDPGDTVYHFACLSNENILHTVNSESWPLNQKFWDQFKEEKDWGIRICRRAEEQKGAYFEFCLFYGLLFNKRKFAISYVHNAQNQKCYPYFMLQLLNCKEDSDSSFTSLRKQESVPVVPAEPEKRECNYSPADFYSYVVCPYRFQLIFDADQTFRYRTDFLIQKYLALLISQELPATGKSSEMRMRSELENILDEKKEFFPDLYRSEQEDVFKDANRNLKKRKKGLDSAIGSLLKEGVLLELKELTDDQRQEIAMADLQQIQLVLTAANENISQLDAKPGRNCLYCPVRDICLQSYIEKKI